MLIVLSYFATKIQNILYITKVFGKNYCVTFVVTGHKGKQSGVSKRGTPLLNNHNEKPKNHKNHFSPSYSCL